MILLDDDQDPEAQRAWAALDCEPCCVVVVFPFRRRQRRSVLRRGPRRGRR